MDDDVTLPSEIDFKIDWIGEIVRAVCFPIQAVDEHGRESMLIECQAIEYRMCDFAKMVQHKHSTVLYPHGACSIWDREMLIEILRWHDTVFFADDVKMGMWLQQHRYEMRMAPAVLVDTFAPYSICGPMPNFYNQRVRSWDMAEHVYFWQFLRLIFVTSHRSFVGNIWMKLFQFYSVFSIIADWTRVAVIVFSLMINWGYFLSIMACAVLLNMLISFLWNLFGYRKIPRLRSKWYMLLVFQFYKLLGIFIRVLGMIRAVLVYLPNQIKKPKIPKLEEMVLVQQNIQRETKKPLRIPVWLSQDQRYFEYQHRYGLTVSENV